MPSAIVEEACPGTQRGQRDTDWGATVAADEAFPVDERVVVKWLRTVSVDDWMLDQSNHSYIAAMDEPERRRTLTLLRQTITDHFGTHQLSVPYETWLWTVNAADDVTETR